MLKKIPYPQSQPVLQRFELSEEAATVVSGEMAPLQVIEALQANDLYIDLVGFLCHALPMRETIWWACLALEQRMSDWTAEQQRVIADCKRWVQHPDEAKRRLAEQQAETLGHKCAPGWLAQAVFWNGSGSLGEPGQPVVLPPEFLYAKAAAGAINTAAVIPEWRGSDEFNRRAVAMALDLAQGGSGQAAKNG
ncbi:DUF6931 family protein [Marinobacterium arenosum]|uniref:DUF6931 family protein n=1 Tax=Marinobacterium arenosum TaxID=2862496 RepID=UPI001C93BFB1|nr:hypothetical protein [Marinobacterium arenosum]MBY4677089.1 hypothetical protein [Marinobacterium arenosum]